VLLPWPPDVDGLEAGQRLVADGKVHMAVLDKRFLQAAARWPALMVAVLRRLNDQEHRVAVTGAICQLPRVEDRILALLRHFGSRVGRVCPDGLRVPLPLTHRALGELVGARRPTVSIALANLSGEGQLRRLEDGTWLVGT
jgi:CRP/FNR family transcriptional regulator, cyclic AMP receptor protein